MTNRLENMLDMMQPREQAGFRSRFSTMDHIQVLREIIERCNEYEQPLCLAFIDYEKAFDSVYTSSVVEVLKEQRIDEAYVDLIQNIYSRATSAIRLNRDSEKINIEKGV